MEAAELGTARYVSVTTFRRSGEPVPTPVWIAPLGDGRLGFTTDATSGKAKRLRHTARVTMQACDLRGRVNPIAAVVDATAQLHTEGPAMDRVQGAIVRKYGMLARLVNAAQRVQGRIQPAKARAPAVVVVTVP